MKNLIIIGAGGMGRQLYHFAQNCKGYNETFVIKGFVDDKLNALDLFENYPPLLGSIDNYEIKERDVFVNSIGDISVKKKCIEKIISKGGQFITLIHNTADIGCNVIIGKGCIIASSVVIGVDVQIGDYTLIQDGSVIGHDVIIEDWVRVDCHVVCIANVNLANEVCIHTASVINHNVRIGEGATVGACSFVIRNVAPHVTVFGNPARKI